MLMSKAMIPMTTRSSTSVKAQRQATRRVMAFPFANPHRLGHPVDPNQHDVLATYVARNLPPSPKKLRIDTPPRSMVERLVQHDHQDQQADRRAADLGDVHDHRHSRLVLLTLFLGGTHPGLFALGGLFALLCASTAYPGSGHVHELTGSDFLFAIRAGLSRTDGRCALRGWHEPCLMAIRTPIAPGRVLVDRKSVV